MLMGIGRRRQGVNIIGGLCSRQVGVGRLSVILLVSVIYLRYIQFFLVVDRVPRDGRL